MEIRYLQHEEIDKKKWDSCIAKSFNGIIYAYSWYLDIVSENWDALVEDDYKAVFPLTQKKKYKVNYLYPPFFTQQLGVFSISKLQDDKVEKFINAIPTKFRFIEINLNKYNNIKNSNFLLIPNKTHEIDLISTYQQLYKNFSSNTKRNIKKALHQKLSLNKNTSPSEIIKLFRNNRGKNISTLSDNDYNKLKRLINMLIKKEKAEIWSAYNQKNELCAGVFFINSNNKTIFLFSGRNAEAKENGAIPYIINQYIFENSQKNLILDFAGSNDLNLARFYKSFGSKECIYFQLKINNLPWYYKLLKK
jgi:hypothetical protein